MSIQHFSALQVVESVHIFEVLVEVLQSAPLAQHPPQILNVSFTRLKITIDASRELFKSSNFELVMKFCPSLLDITISVSKELTDTDLFQKGPCSSTQGDWKFIKSTRHYLL